MSRKRIASLVLLIGLVVVGAKLFSAGDRLARFTVVYRVPDGTTRLEVVAPAKDGGEPLARFVAVPGGPEVVHEARLPPGAHELVITLTTPDGERVDRRTIRAEADTEVRIDLSR